MKLEGLTINFMGDSITEGVGASSKETVYHAVLAREAGLKEARNYGISATRFAYQHGTSANYAKGDGVDQNCFCRRFDKMSDDADAVVVFGGTNDFGHGDAEIGCFEDRTPDTFYGACHFLFSGLVKKYLGKPVIIMTPTHRTDEKNPNKSEVLRDYVNIIREVAEFYSLPVCDLYAYSGMQPRIEEIKTKYMPDGLHPGDQGNAAIARKLLAFLRAM